MLSNRKCGKWHWCFLLILIVFFGISGCAKQTDENEPAIQNESITPTGYDDGGVQMSYILYLDHYYRWMKTTDTLPSGYYEVGKTIGDHTGSVPLNEFEISRYDEDCPVYASDEDSGYIYVMRSDESGYVQFELMSEESVEVFLSDFLPEQD